MADRFSVIDSNVGDESFRTDLELVLNADPDLVEQWVATAIEGGSLHAVHGHREDDDEQRNVTFAHVASFLLRHAVGNDSIQGIKEAAARAAGRGDLAVADPSSALNWLDRLAADDRVIGSALAENQYLGSRRPLLEDHTWFVDARVVADAQGRLYGYAPLVLLTVFTKDGNTLSVDLLEGEVRDLRESLDDALKEIGQLREDLGDRLLVMPGELEDALN